VLLFLCAGRSTVFLSSFLGACRGLPVNWLFVLSEAYMSSLFIVVEFAIGVWKVLVLVSKVLSFPSLLTHFLVHSISPTHSFLSSLIQNSSPILNVWHICFAPTQFSDSFSHILIWCSTNRPPFLFPGIFQFSDWRRVLVYRLDSYLVHGEN